MVLSIEQVILLFIFIFGLTVGSFLNVLIVRLPIGKGIFLPRSHCQHCNKVIPFYHNIPLISFLWLRGKCGQCNAPISFTYPLVELAGGLAALVFITPSKDMTALFHGIILFGTFCVFLCHFIVDLRHQILPDILNIYLGILFILYATLFLDWKFSLLGAAVGFAIPYLVAMMFYLLRGEVGFGGGDIKLYGVLGIYLGALGVACNMVLSCLLGSVVGVVLILAKKMNRKTPIPFGPFIITVASWQIFFPTTAQKYLSALLFMP